MTTFATIGHMYIFGMAPVGPYHYNKTIGWMQRIPEVRWLNYLCRDGRVEWR